MFAMLSFQNMMVSERMDHWKLLVFFVPLNNPCQCQGIGFSMEFLEAFTAAHDRDSTVVIAEKNSGTERIHVLVLLIFFCRIIKQADSCYDFEK